MEMLLAVLLLTASEPNYNTITHDTEYEMCDHFEINTVNCGMQQIIFWDSCGNVREWAIYKPNSITVSHNHVEWKRNGKKHKVFFNTSSVTNSQHDPEIANRNIVPVEYRNKMFNGKFSID